MKVRKNRVEEAWLTLEGRIRKIFTEAVNTAVGKGLGSDYPSLFVDALLGRGAAIKSRIERRLVTMIGMRAKEFITPFFKWTTPVDHPFDFEGEPLIKKDIYVVKVVSGTNAFNSTELKALQEAEGRYPHNNLVVLTVHGIFKGGNHVRNVGRNIKWLDGFATWYFLTGDKTAYKRFVILTYMIGRAVRSKLEEMLMKKRR